MRGAVEGLVALPGPMSGLLDGVAVAMCLAFEGDAGEAADDGSR